MCEIDGSELLGSKGALPNKGLEQSKASTMTGLMSKWMDRWSNEQIHVHTFKTFLSVQNIPD